MADKSVRREASNRNCSGKRVLAGFNDLATTDPHLAKEWGVGNTLTPYEVSRGQNLKVVWVCGVGHEWESPIKARAVMGQGCPYCSNKRVLVGFNDLATVRPDIAATWHPTLNSPLTPRDVVYGSGERVWWLCEKGHEWSNVVAQRLESGCFACWSPNGSSQGEVELAEWLQELLGGREVMVNSRSVIAPYELGVYVPSLNIAFEYNGVYWHSENNGKDRNYHKTKHELCAKQNIQLIQVWEDDWEHKQTIVKRAIAHKLGLSGEKRTFARNTTVVPITQKEADVFMENNHIQGTTTAGIRIGLYDTTSNLVAVMLLKSLPSGGGLDLLRYATNTHVIGGFGKLLKHVETTQQPPKIVTFSDNEISDGALYQTHGFQQETTLPPDYSYAVRGRREHKFLYRKERFSKDPNLKYDPEMTEPQLANLNGLWRVWDSGKIKWVKHYPMTPV